MARRSTLVAVMAAAAALVGCSSDDSSHHRAVDASMTADTSDSNSTADVQRGADAADTSVSDPDSASPDSGSEPDTGTVDTGPTDTGTPDTGTPDAGPIPHQNTCDNGPLAEPIDGCAPDPLPSTGDPREDCVRRINQLRWECQCLPPLQRWHQAESCADQQASYDAQNNTAHGGFRDNVCSPRGMAQNECPGWGTWSSVNSRCLQMMWDEGPGEPFSQHGHYINMSSTRYTKVACGEGDGWFVQNFR